MLARARREPEALVIGIDASAAAMAEWSRRAARRPDRGGLRNALFAVAAIERPPCELLGVADELTITFPWGSLLRGLLAVDDEAAAGIASLLRVSGRATALLSITDRDALDVSALNGDDAPGIARRWAPHGLTVEAFEHASAGEVAASGSSWARRLVTGPPRPVWRLALRLDRKAPGETPVVRLETSGKAVQNRPR